MQLVLLHIEIFYIRPYFSAPQLERYFSRPRNNNVMIAMTITIAIHLHAIIGNRPPNPIRAQGSLVFNVAYQLQDINRELKQTTKTTATRTSLTTGLMSRTIAVHVRYKSLYIPLTSSAKQQREITKFGFVDGTWMRTANFSYFHLELNDVIALYLA